MKFVLLCLFALFGLSTCWKPERERFLKKHIHGTLILYAGTVECDTPFCSMIYYSENDEWSDDEDFHFVPLHCSSSGRLEYKTHVFMDGDDGLFDNFYEPMMEIYHNCTPNGKTTKMIKQLMSVNSHERYGHGYFFIQPGEEDTDYSPFSSVTEYTDYDVTHGMRFKKMEEVEGLEKLGSTVIGGTKNEKITREFLENKEAEKSVFRFKLNIEGSGKSSIQLGFD